MPPTLTLIQQERLIRLRYPKSKTWYRTIEGHKALWIELRLQVAPIYESYLVRICYSLGVRPLVFVIDPKPVEEAQGNLTPHLNYDSTLCLYDPDKEQWNESDPIAYTIIPWTLRWLFHYENWLSTEVWLGDSLELPSNDVPTASTTGPEQST